MAIFEQMVIRTQGFIVQRNLTLSHRLEGIEPGLEIINDRLSRDRQFTFLLGRPRLLNNVNSVPAQNSLKLFPQRRWISTNVAIQSSDRARLSRNHICSAGIRIPHGDCNQTDRDAVEHADSLHSSADRVVNAITKMKTRNEVPPGNEQTRQRNQLDEHNYAETCMQL